MKDPMTECMQLNINFTVGAMTVATQREAPSFTTKILIVT